VALGVAEASGGVLGVLEIAADGPGVPERSHHRARLHAVAGFGVDGHRHLDAPRDPRGGGEHLVGRRTLIVLVAERGRHAEAGGRDHREPGVDHGLRRRHIPRVREQQRRAGLVQRLQQIAPAQEVLCR
jgi:hypothetical protein